jgi:hypothetical protein
MVCYTLIPAGPHLTNGCFQTRAWGGGEVSGHSRAAGWQAQVGGQNPGHGWEGKLPGTCGRAKSRVLLGRRRVWDTESNRLNWLQLGG